MRDGAECRKRFDVAEAKAAKIRQLQLKAPGDIAECVGSLITIHTGIGHGSNAHAVKNNPDYAVKARQADLPLASEKRIRSFLTGHSDARGCSLKFIFETSRTFPDKMHERVMRSNAGQQGNELAGRGQLLV